MNNYAHFIASYGKPENILTLSALQRVNTKYPIYIVVGTDDPKLEQYKQMYDNLIVFDKADYRDKIDCIGSYITSDKICTYSRLAIYDYAKTHCIKFVGYMFDDIKKFRLRYESSDDKIRSVKEFDIDRIIDMYINLLNSSKDIYIVGPPQSSYYIGVDSSRANSYITRYGNFFIYDIDKELEPYQASTIEDMTIVIHNNMRGKLSICPFGLQVECREPAITKDSYGPMSKLEYYEQNCIVDSGYSVNAIPVTIHYKNYIPKIISESCKHNELYKKGRLF